MAGNRKSSGADYLYTMDPMDVVFNDESSSDSDESLCEHGYPLHEDSLTLDRMGDKAVVTVTDIKDNDRMFLVPFMRGESPLNEAIRYIIKADPLKPGSLVEKEADISDDYLFSPIEDGGNKVPLLPGSSHSGGIQNSRDSNPLRPVPVVMTAKEGAPYNEEDKKDTMDDGNMTNNRTEYYKMMMRELWGRPLEDKIREIAEAEINANMKGDKADHVANGQNDPDLDTQFSGYSKLLNDLSSAMDESLKDIDYDGKPKPFICELCDWGFSCQADLSNHHRLHSGERPYQCEFCIGNFQDKTALLNHRRQHTGEKPYKCEICQTSFSQKHSLVVHKNVHTGEKKYKCDLCDSSFVCRSNLNVHMRIHTGAKPYTCEFCQTSYAQKSQLTVHKRIHTGEKPYKCQLCPSAFSVRGHLIHHIRTHTGEKPHVCLECGSSFTKRCNLKVHMRSHTGEQPYRCAFCDQAFHLKNMLTKHLLNFHRIAKKMHTPPQKEGDAPQSPLDSLQTPESPSSPRAIQNKVHTLRTRSSKSGKNTAHDSVEDDGSPTTCSSENVKESSKSGFQKSGKSGRQKSSGRKNQSTPQNSRSTKLKTITEPKMTPTKPHQNSTSKISTRNNKNRKESQNLLRSESQNGGKKSSTRRRRGKETLDHPTDNDNVVLKDIEPQVSKRKKRSTARHENLTLLHAEDSHVPSGSLSITKSKLGNSPLTKIKDNLAKSKTDPDKDEPEFAAIDLSTPKSKANRTEEISDRPLSSTIAQDLMGPGNHSNLGYPINMPMGFPGFGSLSPWSNYQAAGFQQSSPVAQRMAEQWHSRGGSSGALPPAAMKSMLEAYAASGIPGAPIPEMLEAYYSGIVGNSSTQGMLGRKFTGSPKF